MATAVMDTGEAGWQGTQQAGSGEEALSPAGPGQRSDTMLQALGAEHANTKTAVCRGTAGHDVGAWEVRRLIGSTCTSSQRRHLLRLAGARVADAGVGIPEVRALRRAPLNGWVGRSDAWREWRVRLARGMRVRGDGRLAIGPHGGAIPHERRYQAPPPFMLRPLLRGRRVGLLAREAGGAGLRASGFSSASHFCEGGRDLCGPVF